MKLPTEVTDLLTRLESNGFEAFVVGGCVRDSLLNREPADWDICTSAHPEEVQAVFPDHFVIPTGLKHGTVTVVSGDINVEITTYRKDGIYLDNRHPESVTYTTDVREDLKRRDFTINAMAYSPKRGLLDYFGGKDHLKNKFLCCVGDPAIRFSEDALRILRGLRFAAGYRLTIEPETAKAIHLCRRGLKSISAERILTELKKLLQAPDFAKILTEYPDILGTIFPETEALFLFSAQWKGFMQNLAGLSASFPLRLAAIFYWCHTTKDYQSLCESSIKRLNPDRKTYQDFLTLIQCQDSPLPSTLAETRRFVGKYGIEILAELLEWYSIQLHENIDSTQKFLNEIQKNNLCCTIKELAITGNDLMKKGLSGAEIGQALNHALYQVTEGNLPNEKETLLIFLFS